MKVCIDEDSPGSCGVAGGKPLLLAAKQNINFNSTWLLKLTATAVALAGWSGFFPCFSK